MAKLSDKEKVLRYMESIVDGSEVTTTKITNAVKAPQPSIRRILAELRVEGYVTRGITHGTWIYIAAPSDADFIEGEILDTPHTPTEAEAADLGRPEDVDPLDVSTRPDVTDEPGVTLHIYKVDAQGDTLYVEATDEADALSIITQTIGEIPAELMTFTVVETLPEGEELLTPYGDGVDSDEGDIDNIDDEGN